MGYEELRGKKVKGGGHLFTMTTIFRLARDRKRNRSTDRGIKESSFDFLDLGCTVFTK